MSSLERFSEYRGFGLERFHCIYAVCTASTLCELRKCHCVRTASVVSMPMVCVLQVW